MSALVALAMGLQEQLITGYWIHLRGFAIWPNLCHAGGGVVGATAGSWGSADGAKASAKDAAFVSHKVF